MTDQQILDTLIETANDRDVPANKRWVVAAQKIIEAGGPTFNPDTLRCRYKRYKATHKDSATIDEAIESLKQTEQAKVERVSIKEFAGEIDRLRAEVNAFQVLQANIQSHTIRPSSKKASESTVVTLWSDWHIEERVDQETVNGLNEFNLDIAKERTEKLFRKTVDFTKMYQQDTVIKEMVIALLGDFITNDLHDESAETAQLLPIEATLFAQSQIVTGINFILENTDVNLTIPCHSGNHARTTRKTHHSTEHGHSLEFMMYHNLANYYRSEPRVKFLIPRAYHSFVQIYDYTIRFHHGHNIKYGGGIGGLFIPAYKAISQWDKSRRADLDCFGHFHQTKDGGNFYCNGSLIGFNPFAISIKADFEKPKQNLFLVHKELGRSIMSPIHL